VAAPPPARRSRKGLWIGLAVLGVLALACCGGGAALLLPVMNQSSTVSAPPQVAGMDRVDDPELSKLADELAAQVKKDLSADGSALGFYAPGGDKAHGVVAIAVSGTFLFPDSEIDQVFKSMGTGGTSVTGVRDYDAGPLGGTVRCGTATLSGATLPVCAWADHGSFGVGMFLERPVDEAAKVFLDFRKAMVART